MPAKSKPKVKVKRTKQNFERVTTAINVELVLDRKEQSLMLNQSDGFTTGWYPYGWWRSHYPTVWDKAQFLFDIKE